MIASTTPGIHNPRISAQTVTNRLREIGKRSPYTMYVLYAAFLFWPSIFHFFGNLAFVKKQNKHLYTQLNLIINRLSFLRPLENGFDGIFANGLHPC